MHRVLSSLALATALAASAGFAGPAEAQDSADHSAQVRAHSLEIVAELKQLAAANPVRTGADFSAASALIKALGAFKDGAQNSCEYPPTLPSWDYPSPGLHDNTMANLTASYAEGETRGGMRDPAAGLLKKGLCDYEKRLYTFTYSRLKRTLAALRREGY